MLVVKVRYKLLHSKKLMWNVYNQEGLPNTQADREVAKNWIQDQINITYQQNIVIFALTLHWRFISPLVQPFPFEFYLPSAALSER